MYLDIHYNLHLTKVSTLIIIYQHYRFQHGKYYYVQHGCLEIDFMSWVNFIS